MFERLSRLSLLLYHSLCYIDLYDKLRIIINLLDLSEYEIVIKKN